MNIKLEDLIDPELKRWKLQSEMNELKIEIAEAKMRRAEEKVEEKEKKK